MNRWRWIVLLAGPLPILAGSWLVAHWARPSDLPLVASNVLRFSPGLRTDGSEADSQRARGAKLAREQLAAACASERKLLAARLGGGGTLSRPPFVLGGDLPSAELLVWYERTIRPTAVALQHAYFDAAIDRPITLLLFSSELSYNHYAWELFGDEGISIFGYYKPDLRTAVVNVATGGGTLLHELTHALAAFDFPDMPDWLNEGLASLHEEARVASGGATIEGLVNWRLDVLREAIDARELGSLHELVAGGEFRGPQEAIHYAQARYFCMYLQRRGRLASFYRRFRAAQGDDPTGAIALQRELDSSWQELDYAFRAWVAGLD